MVCVTVANESAGGSKPPAVRRCLRKHPTLANARRSMWRYLTTLTSIGLLIELYLVKVIQSSTAAALIVDLISAEAKSQTFHLNLSDLK